MKAAIFDLDDTLVRDEDDEDNMAEQVRDLAEHAKSSRDHLAIILTARTENIRKETEELLERYGIDFDRLYMRPEKDFSLPDKDYKESVLEKLEQEGIEITFAADDKRSVLKMWKDNDIMCIELPEKHKIRHRLYRFLRRVYGQLPSVVQNHWIKFYRRYHRSR